MYQDWAPKSLGERVLGKDGKQLFNNLSIETLRGQSNIQMMPDVVSGSKNYRKQLQLWAFSNLQNSVWINPQVNPLGNWNLIADTLQEVLGLNDTQVKRWIGKAPQGNIEDSVDLENEWARFMQGDDFEPPEGATQMAMMHFEGHMKQKEEKYHELDEEYRNNFDAHLFKTSINYMKFMQDVKRNQMADAMAQNAIMTHEAGLIPEKPGLAPVQLSASSSQSEQPVIQPGLKPNPGIQPGQEGI